MSEERTEFQVITMEPLKVSLGGQPVNVPILKAGKALEWKKEWGEAVMGYRSKINKPDELRKAEASTEDIIAASLGMLEEVLVGAQEKVLNLVCSYADKTGSEITGKRILDEAWDEEIKVMWEKMYEAIFSPLATSLPEAIAPKKKSQ